MLRKTFVILLTIALSYPIFLKGQNNVTSRIRVIRGANLVFNFSTYNRYASGISYENYTYLQLYFNDTIAGGLPNPSGLGWKLTVRALQPNIAGTWGGYLNLNTIRMRVLFNSIEYGPFTLTSSDQTLVSGNDLLNFTGTVQISYDCGTLPANNLINQLPDTYVVDLEFTLSPQ